MSGECPVLQKCAEKGKETHTKLFHFVASSSHGMTVLGSLRYLLVKYWKVPQHAAVSRIEWITSTQVCRCRSVLLLIVSSIPSWDITNLRTWIFGMIYFSTSTFKKDVIFMSIIQQKDKMIHCLNIILYTEPWFGLMGLNSLNRWICCSLLIKNFVN